MDLITTVMPMRKATATPPMGNSRDDYDDIVGLADDSGNRKYPLENDQTIFHG
jgi:hypothetical protein